MKISDWLLVIGVLLYVLCAVSMTTILLNLGLIFVILGISIKVLGR